MTLFQRQQAKENKLSEIYVMTSLYPHFVGLVIKPVVSLSMLCY